MSARTVPDASQHARLERATAGLDPPFVAVDLDAFDANALDLARRAGSSGSASLTTTPSTRTSGRPARRSPSRRPASVPPVPTAHTMVPGSVSAPDRTCSAISKAAST